MIDLGVVLATIEGEEVARTFIRTMPPHPERTSPEVPAINGFDVDKWRAHGALTDTAAVDSLRAFYAAHTAGRRVLMVAYNSKFDAAFLDHLFRGTGHSLDEIHYYYVENRNSHARAPKRTPVRASPRPRKSRRAAADPAPSPRARCRCPPLQRAAAHTRPTTVARPRPRSPSEA